LSKHVEIVRLSERGLSQREVAAVLRCSLATVNKTLKAARAKGLTADGLAGGGEAAARELLFGREERPPTRVRVDFEEVNRQLRRDSVSLSLLWDEYSRACAAAGKPGYQYSRYCALYDAWRKDRGLAAPKGLVKHPPGRLAEVDWAGLRARYTDRGSGETRRPWVFVGCLPCSQLLYVEAFDDMKQSSWSAAHVRMLRYFGGVPELVTPDNCKTGVARADYYDPDVNRDYQALAAHYGFAVVPARPVTPKDKASAENTVKFCQTWVVAYLRAERFFSLGELNRAVRARAEELNAQPFKGLDWSRRDVFDAEEAPALGPLPASDYEPAEWKRVKAGIDYCVQVDRRRYSVPYRLRGEGLDVRVTATAVEVFCGGERVASHPRLTGRLGEVSVDGAHMPEAHRAGAEEWSPARLEGWARSVGPACLEVVSGMLAAKPHPALAYRACLAVLRYSKDKGGEFLEGVCAEALSLSARPGYKQVKALASKAEPPGGPGWEEPALPGLGDAGLVRGADSYRWGGGL
jgi:transposase